MIKYDWNILSKHSYWTIADQYSYKTILNVLYYLTDIENLKYGDKKILRIIAKFKDNSGFLISPMKLIAASKKHTVVEIYFYLELAAYRSYFNYTQTGSLTLPTYYIKGKYSLDKLKLNTALIVTDEEIVFKYEEK